MNEPDRLRQFVCPLCASQQAHRVVVRRQNGQDYSTSFFNCSGCTVMFLDVERFARLMRRVVNSRGWLEDVPTRDVTTRQGAQPAAAAEPRTRQAPEPR